MKKFSFLRVSTAFILLLFSHPAFCTGLRWQVVDGSLDSPIKVFGLPWIKENKSFGRLPKSSQALVMKENPEAWSESLCPSGARIRFRTNSSSLAVNVLHGDDRISTPHMASTSVAGMDLYEIIDGQEFYRGTSRPQSGLKAYEYQYIINGPKKTRDWTIYLPTYARLEKLEIGVDQGASLEAGLSYSKKPPIVFYGTSITQSACSSRGSNGYVPALSRLLNTDVVNLGFSGSGRGEKWMADLVSQVDASVYVIDSVANMSESLGGKTLMELNYKKFVEIIRHDHPKTPIVLMTRIRFADVMTTWGEMISDTDAKYEKLLEPLYETYREFKKKGDEEIFIFKADKVIPRAKNPPLVDGIHPDDRGFADLTRALEPFLRKILKSPTF